MVKSLVKDTEFKSFWVKKIVYLPSLEEIMYMLGPKSQMLYCGLLDKVEKKKYVECGPVSLTL